MTDLPPHPLTAAAPYCAFWRRGSLRRFETRPGRHAELVVLLGVGGQAQYLLDGDVLRLGRGSLVWALAGQAHMLLSQSEGFDMWVALAHPKLWPDQPSVPVSLKGDATIGHRQLSSRDFAELEHTGQSLSMADGAPLADGVRWWLWRAWQAAQEAPRTGREHGLHSAVARAAIALRSDLEASLPEIAGSSGLSDSQLRRVFRREMGVSLSHYRRQVRLDAVDQAVARGTGLTTAALDAGYGSYAQFFRDFRAARGFAPRDWYQQKISPENEEPRGDRNRPGV